MSAPFHAFLDGVEAPKDTVSLDDFRDEPEDDEQVPEAPQWVWCCVSARYGNQVWAHSQIENHPDGLLYRAAGPLPANDAGIRIFSGGTEIRLRKAGHVSHGALVLAVRPGEFGGGYSAPPNGPTKAQPRKRRKPVDSNTLDPSIPISDDTFIDQRCPRFPRDLYMRMARANAFPNEKRGRRRVAMFGDVKRAFAARETDPTAPPIGSDTTAKSEDERADNPDPLERLRQRYGLMPRGKG